MNSISSQDYQSYITNPFTNSIKEEVNAIMNPSPSKWGGLEVVWTEIKSEEAQRIDHIYEFVVNHKTEDLYLDDTKGKIWVKFVAHMIFQPIFLHFKTVRHGLMLSAIYEIYAEVQEMKVKERNLQSLIPLKEKTIRCLKILARNLVDTVRTPLYIPPLCIIGIAAVIIGPFAPKEFLYEMRVIAGRVESALYRADWKMIPFKCFQPTNLNIVKYFSETREDTFYRNPESFTEKGLVNLAAGAIEHIRTNRFPWNAYQGIPCRLYPKNKKYVSSNVKEKNRFSASSIRPFNKIDSTTYTLGKTGSLQPSISYEIMERGLKDWVKEEGGKASEAAQRIKEAFLSKNTELDLSYLSLKTLPPEIGYLSTLTSLTASYNQLTNLPETIEKLSQLEIIELDVTLAEKIQWTNSLLEAEVFIEKW